jgi:TPP-dependent pyruvate/acetoin dehydrogenase alpha subunit
MLGDMISILTGAVLAERMKGRTSVALTWIGDGGTSTGAFHEGFNLACVLKAPLVVVVENNQYAYSTPTRMQTANTRFVDRAQAYGCAGESVDGDDVLAVYEATRKAVERARAGAGPTLIEAETMRMRGHAEHDDMKYVPEALLEEWKARDPIARFEKHLLEANLAAQSDLDALTVMIERQLDADVAFAEASPFPDAATGLSGVYGDRDVKAPVPPLVAAWEAGKARG